MISKTISYYKIIEQLSAGNIIIAILFKFWKLQSTVVMREMDVDPGFRPRAFGMLALPGTYSLRLHVLEQSLAERFSIRLDPRIEDSDEDSTAYERVVLHMTRLSVSTEA
jgi:hypothetical protein